MKELDENRRSAPKRKARKLAQLNQKITRLSSELETLHFMQDRLEKELETDDQTVRDSRSGSNGRMGG